MPSIVRCQLKAQDKRSQKVVGRGRPKPGENLLHAVRCMEVSRSYNAAAAFRALSFSQSFSHLAIASGLKCFFKTLLNSFSSTTAP